MGLGYAALVLYGGLLSFYLVSLRYLKDFENHLELNNNPEVRHMRTYRFAYLTSWNYTFQITFILIAILDEASKFLCFHEDTKKLLGKFRAIFYHSVLFPCSVLVMSFFWVLYSINQKLIMPRNLADAIPMWLNHILHSSVAVAAILELLLPKRGNFVKYRTAFPITLFIAIFYSVVFSSVYIWDGIWLYPIFGMRGWYSAIPLLGLLTFVCLISAKFSIIVQDLKRPIVIKSE